MTTSEQTKPRFDGRIKPKAQNISAVDDGYMLHRWSDSSTPSNTKIRRFAYVAMQRIMAGRRGEQAAAERLRPRWI